MICKNKVYPPPPTLYVLLEGVGFCILLNQTIIFCPILLSVICFSFVLIIKQYTDPQRAVKEARYRPIILSLNLMISWICVLFSKFRFYHYFEGILEASPSSPVVNQMRRAVSSSPTFAIYGSARCFVSDVLCQSPPRVLRLRVFTLGAGGRLLLKKRVKSRKEYSVKKFSKLSS